MIGLNRGATDSTVPSMRRYEFRAPMKLVASASGLPDRRPVD
jgi:hypothetical protein